MSTCKCGWYSRRPALQCNWHTCQPRPGPDWARSRDRSALTLSLPDQGGLTEEDGDERGKDGVGEEGPRGDPRCEQVSNHLCSRRRSFQERVRRRTDLWVTPPLVVYTRTSIAGQQHAALCPSSCSHNPYSFKSATICCHNQYHFKFIQPIPITVPALPTIH